MKFVFGDKQMDFTEDEVRNFMQQAAEHGITLEGHHHEDPGHYLKKAKENISKLIGGQHPIETEEDAKAIIAHCFGWSDRQSDLLYEIIEFAIGMRMEHIAKH